MEEIKAPKKERKFLKAIGNITKLLANELVMGIARKFIGKAIDKVGNKRQGLVIAFALVAGISYASIDSIPYPITGNKQRLGFQTTGNGLVYRGRSNDTITKPSSYVDKNVKSYLLLDSVSGTIFVWRQTYWDSILVGGGGGAAFTQPIDSLFFDTSVPSNNVDTAKMRWDSELGTVVLGMYDQVPNELGFKSFWLVKNQTGSTITKGSIVYANGTVGASGRITIDKFIADGSIDAKYLIGITAHDLTNGEDGYVISFGKIRQVNTDTFAAGAILYPSPTVAGVWTDVEPVAPNIDMPIGFCINSHVNNGTIAIRVASGYDLSELHDVSITSPVENSSLYYKSGLWRDTTAALLVSDTASMLTPYLRDADTVTLSNRINLKLNIADTSAFARDNQISGTSGQVAYFNSSSSVVSDTALRWSAANKSLGINMTTVPSGASLIIKNSQEPVRTTVVPTQTFGADTTNWTRGAGWTFNGTQAVATAATGDLTYTPALTITPGFGYVVTSTHTYTSGTLVVRIGNANITLSNFSLSSNPVLLIPTTSTGGFRFTVSSFTGNLDGITVEQVANPAPVLFAGQDDNSTNLYSSLRMPNSTTIAFGGGARYTTGVNNFILGPNAMLSNVSGNQSVALGANALQNNISGSENVAMGNNALANNTTGSQNTAIGQGALGGNVNGLGNIAIGRQSLSNMRGGVYNIALGNNALVNNQGSENIAFGLSALGANTNGSNNFSIQGLGSNTTGNNNISIQGLNTNTVGIRNIGFGINSGRVIRRGSYNIAIGSDALGNSTFADTLTGSNNIAIGNSASLYTSGAAAGNVAIGNIVYLPTNNGSNQGVYQNVLFFTGASGLGTTIAAASKAGIKTNAPNRDLEVAGEVRITDLTTDAPTRLVGADADGDLGQVTLGAGLSLASSSLLADTSFLVTRFDTASMLTPYFRDADTTSLNLTSRFAAKLNISDTASMLTNYLRTGTAASTYLPLTGGTLTGGLTGTNAVFSGSMAIGFPFAYKPLEVFSNVNDFVSVGTNQMTQFQWAGIHFGYRQANYDYRSSAIVFQRNEIPPYIDATGKIHLLNVSYANGGRSADLRDAKLTISNIGGYVGINDTSPEYQLDVNGTLGVTGATTLSSTLGVTGISSLGNKTFVGNLTDFTPASGGNHNIRLESNDVSSIGFHDYLNTIGNIKFSGATGFVIGASDGLYGPHSTTIAGNATLSAPLTVNSSAVFNEAATDSDFRVESQANANMLFVDASTSRVGIGYASPTKTLDVNGELRINTVTATPTSLLGKDGSNVVGNVTLGNSLTLSSGTLSVNNKITNINTSSYSILSTDYYIDNFNSSSTTIVLPSAASNLYRELKFKNSSTGALTANVDIIPLSGSGTTTTILSATNAKWCTLVSDGADWRIMQSN